jgi:hypothetical protein
MFQACTNNNDVLVSHGPISNFFAACVGETSANRAAAEQKKPLRALSPNAPRAESGSPSKCSDALDDGLVLSADDVRNYLLRHNPAKICMLNRIMVHYKGRKQELRREFMEKYGEGESPSAVN